MGLPPKKTSMRAIAFHAAMKVLLSKPENTLTLEEKEKMKLMLAEREFGLEVEYAIRASGVDTLKAFFVLDEISLREISSIFVKQLENTHHILTLPGIPDVKIKRND